MRPISKYVDDLKRLSKSDLVRLVLDLYAEVQDLKAAVARGRKNSSTSSKPPSSDIVKPPPTDKKDGEKKKRKTGGQPGHEKHERKPFPPEELDGEYEYTLACCPSCGGALKSASQSWRGMQQVELVGRSFQITEHYALRSWCPRCRRHQDAELPETLRKSGLFGPRMRALVAYFKGTCHMSYKTIQSFLRDVLGISVSTGYLAKVVNKAGAALAVPYAELCDALAGEPWLNVDETGHRDGGNRHWTWCFRADRYSVFKIDPSRGSCVIEDEWGES